MSQLKLKTLTGRIRLLTGLHIGAGNDAVEIGGMDNPIIRDPVTKLPYIPGSSLKGKMRSLMEWYTGRVNETHGKVCPCGTCDVCIVFGSSAESGARGPTRLVVRDAKLNEAFEKRNIDGTLIEEKSENSLDRITAKANPRKLERVTAGAEFDFEILYRMYDMGKGFAADEALFETIVLKALTLTERDYLGGYGSRGSGRIKFNSLTDESGRAYDLAAVKL